MALFMQGFLHFEVVVDVGVVILELSVNFEGSRQKVGGRKVWQCASNDERW